jgi:hypothetical protein
MQRHSGMFKQGQSGNPSGRPKADKTICDLARAHTQEAIEVLLMVVHNQKAPSAARVQACNAILDRGWGRPVQHNENNDRIISTSLKDFLDEIHKADSEKLVFDL